MNFNCLVWLPLIALSITLIACFFQAVAMRRRIARKCIEIERFAERIIWNIQKLARVAHGELSLLDVRKNLTAQSAQHDPVLQLLIESAGMPTAAQSIRVDSMVHR